MGTAISLRIVLAIGAFVLPVGAGIEDPVHIDAGPISGVPGAIHGVRVFRGIPFALPPVGGLRWRAPQSVVAWQGVRRADRFSKICMQRPHEKGSYYQMEFYREPEESSEDCLYLNVWTPARSAEEKLPVLVWIHGGGFAQGSGSTPSQSGEGLARKGVVVVTFNYRLGVFGLLAHPELSKESQRHTSGNYALMDQIAALRWVQRNIRAFGGDAQRVTVFGQSAGSNSIVLLMTSPEARGLFQRAAGASAFLGGEGAASRNLASLREAEEKGVELGRKLKAHSLAALRDRSADELLQASDRQFRPIVDGYVVPEDPYQVLLEARQTKIPVLLGSNSNERGNYPQPHNAAEYLDFTRRQYPAAAESAMQMFPAVGGKVVEAYLRRERDRTADGMYKWAELMTRAGTPAYLYYFGRVPPARPGETPLGAVHTAEIVYFRNLLDTVERPWAQQDRELADTMSSYLVNFVATGNPNSNRLPKWPVYKAGEVMELGDHIGPIPTPDARELQWFEEYFAREQQAQQSKSVR
jgi:para-nitrobenzyl esterase